MSFIAQSVEITLKDIYGIYDFGFIGNDYDEIWDSLKVPSDFNVEKDEFKSKVDSQLSIILLNHIRNRRNRLLFESDWTQTVDCVLTNKEDWKIYQTKSSHRLWWTRNRHSIRCITKKARDSCCNSRKAN